MSLRILPSLLAFLLAVPLAAQGQMVVVLKDGRRQAFDMSTVARIEFAGAGLPADPPATASPVGSWAWVSGQTLSILANGRLEVFDAQGRKINDGTWETLDPAARRYRFNHREGGWVDTVTLSADGRTLTGRNNHGFDLKGTRR